MISLFPLLRSLSIRSWSDVGWGRNPEFTKQLLLGFFIAFTSALFGGLLLLDLQPKNPFGDWPWPKRLVTGAIVSLLEETLFRGVLLVALLRALKPAVAITALSLFFSVVHFLKPASKIAVQDINMLSGFEIIPTCFEKMADPNFLPHFVNLAIVGAILGWALWKTRSLAMPVGLHAAWVVATCGRGGQTWIETLVLLATFTVVIVLTITSPTLGETTPDIRGEESPRDHP